MNVLVRECGEREVMLSSQHKNEVRYEHDDVETEKLQEIRYDVSTKDNVMTRGTTKIYYDQKGQNALCNACMSGNCTAFNHLLACGVDVNIRGKVRNIGIAF